MYELAPTSEEAIKKHRGLVYKFAKRFSWACGAGLSLDDLVQAGFMGIHYACTSGNYDPSKGCRFSTYAAICIKTAIIKTVDDQSRTVRIPVSHKVKNWKNGKKRTKVHVTYSLDTDYETDSYSSNDASYSPINQLAIEGFQEEACLLNASSVEHHIDQLRQIVNLSFPEGRDRDIVIRTNFDGQTHAEVARSYGISRERARQISARGMKIMKAYGHRVKVQSGLIEERADDT